MPTRAQRWQYPAKAEPVFVEVAVVLPDIDWLVQQPDPVRLPSPQPEQYTLVEFGVPAVILPDIDWLVQQPDPVRHPSELVGEQYAFDPTTPLLDLDWLVEPAVVTRPALRVVPGESFFLRLIELSEVPIDWLVQPPDPVLELPRIVAAGETSTQQPGSPIPPTAYASPTSMVLDAGVVQVQARAEPILVEVPVLPDIDWLLQDPDPVRRLPELIGGQYVSDPTTPLIDLDWLVEPALVVRPPLRVVPGESFFLRLVELSEVPIAWLVQHPDPVRRPPELVGEGEFAFLEEFLPPPLANIDWLVQHLDPVRRPSELVGEQYASDPTTPLLDLDWLIEPAIVIPPPLRVVPGETFFLRLVDLSEIPIGWLQQGPDPILPLPVLPTQSVLVEELAVVVLPDIDWLVQYPDPLPEQPSSVTAGEVLLLLPGAPIPVTSFASPTSMVFDAGVIQTQARAEPIFVEVIALPDISWLVQHPDPLFRPSPIQTEPELAFEHEDLIPIPDWLVQHPDPVRPLERLVPEALAFEFEHELLVPPIDWLHQQPDPIQELRRPSTEPVEPIEVPPLAAFDWLVQYPDPVLPEPPRLGEYVLGELVEIPIDSWQRPASQPVLPIERRQDYYTRPEVVVPPPPALLEWWVQHPDPQFPIALIREFFTFDLAAPLGFIFVLRECETLSRMIDRRLWPSGVPPSGFFAVVEEVEPSGFFSILESALPSGFLQPLEESASPSGYFNIMKIPVPSGYVKPSEELPDPSGFIKSGEENSLWKM